MKNGARFEKKVLFPKRGAVFKVRCVLNSGWVLPLLVVVVVVVDGKNRFEDHISKNVAKMANFWPKIGPDATFAATLNGHKSAIFPPISTFDHTKMTSSSS